MRDQHNLAFPLLVDAHNQLARQFGLVYRVPKEQQGLYRSTFVNLPRASGGLSWGTRLRTPFMRARACPWFRAQTTARSDPIHR